MIRNKIALFLLMFFFIFMTAYSAWHDMRADQQQLNNALLVEKRLLDISQINHVIAELQKERGLTAIYLAAPNEQFLDALQKQYLATTHILNAASSRLDLTMLIKERDILLEQYTHRAGAKETFKQYTQLIEELLLQSEHLVFNTHDTRIKNALITYHILKNIQENAGQLRAKIGTALAAKTLTSQNHQEIIVHHALYHFLMKKAETHQSIEAGLLLKEMQSKSCVHQTHAVIKMVIDESLERVTLTPMQWFKLSTSTLDSIQNASSESLKLIQIDALKIKEEAKNALTQHLLFWIGGALTLIMLLVITFNRSKELTKKHLQLENYKEAIDYSTIVSKTDNKGIITYVNSAFCDISGYETDELLHRPHNIVRHPDMPKEVFQVMWETLQTGKKWKGIVKNLKKDGTSYWVDASISPIFDVKGEVVEYIAIRRDITDIILLNEEIRSTQSELIYRMGEAVESRSKESGHHVQRVAHYSKLLAQVAGLEHEECEIIFAASTMHDIGKLSIPDAILLKADLLTDEEWTVMKTHTEVGYKILEGSERPLLKMAATVAYEHHEHFDGNGYPRGIKADEISIYGRIVAIADVFDALATDRIYKQAWPLKKIFEHLKEQSGKQFDPKLIELFLNHLDQFLEIKSRFKDK
ncbi:MAG: HD domain-containing phosphohydrolase [Campylobacterota bacterium]